MAAEMMRVFLLLAFFVVGLNVNPAEAARPGHVYMLRGFANVFSTGMDSLASELASRGYDATVHSHVESDSLAVHAANLQKSGKGPIVIIGHSLGGPAAIAMATRMKALGAKVALIVTFGPNVSDPVPSNVARVINFYQTQSIVNNTPIPELNCDPNIGRAERRSLAQLRFELQESGLVASANSQEVLFSEPTGLARYPSSCQPAR